MMIGFLHHGLGYIVPFLFILTVLVFVHEFGHYFIARRNGVRVDVFSIGFGPEVFGWHDTPRLAGGRVRVLLHLLAPNHRPQQVTDDLASFWKNTYPQVRKELRIRYPKHAWPEDPWNAPAERRPRRR